MLPTNTTSLASKFIDEINTDAPKARVIKNLLHQGLSINAQVKDNFTGLMYAVLNHHDRIVEYLLKQGANPLLKNSKNQMASDLITDDVSAYTIVLNYELLHATFHLNLAAVTVLINKGACINFQGMGGYSALMIAVEQNNLELVTYLLHSGADLELTNEEGQNVFDLATNPIICELLEAYKIFDNSPINPLHNAISKKTNYFFKKYIQSK